MSFLNPAGLFLLLLIPLIIFFHLFRAARREVNVAALRFWSGEVEQQSSATRINQKILWTPSLLLQLLAVLLASLALAQPVMNATGKGWARTVLIIDNSASMAATDIAGTRFQALRSKVEKVLADLKSGQEAMIIEAGRHPSVKASFTADKSKIAAALRDLEIIEGTANIRDAVKLADQLTRDGLPASIHLFTDAAYAPPVLSETSAPLVWHVVGQASDNVGITAFEIRRSPGSETGYEAFVTLDNVSTLLKNLVLRFAIDAELFYEQNIDLPPQVKRSFIVPFEYDGGGAVRAEIDLTDDLKLDNVAYAILSPPKQRKVLLVSEGNFFLENALRADPTLDVISMRSELFSIESAEADVIVLDRVSVAEIPAGNYLLIQSLPENIPIAETEPLDFPSVVDWDPDHPISRYLDFSNLVIKRTLGVRAEGDCDQVVEANDTPLVIACAGRQRFVFIGFDFLESELPLTATLPILLSNAISWLSSTSLKDSPQYLRAGERFRADINREVSTAQILRPNGEADTVPVKDGTLIYDDTTLFGLYTVVGGSEQHHFAVNLLDPAETNLTPGRGVVSTSVPEGAELPTYSYHHELWWYLALLALVAMLAEIVWVLRERHSPPSRPSLALRGTALVLLALALTRPTLGLTSDSTNVAFLLDLSDSLTETNKLKALQDVERAIKNKGPHDTVQLIAFAGDTNRIELPLGDIGPQTLAFDRDARSTDIAGAIFLALATLPAEGDRRIVLVTDGNENRNTATEAALQADREQVPVYLVPTNAYDQPEVVLERVVLPAEVRQGEAFIAKVVLWSTGLPSAKIELLRDGEPIASADVALKDGKNVFAYRDTPQAEGFHSYEARVTSPQDGIQDNNAAETTLMVRGRPQLLFVDNELDRAWNFVEALRQQHFSVDTIPPEGFSSAADKLNQYDAVILSNAPASSLSDEGMAKLHRYVTEEGGGLIMLGGEKSFGLGGYGATPIEDLMPIHMAPQAKVEVPSQTIVLVLDRSGSMSTEQGAYSRLDLAKQAVQQSIQLMSEDTVVGVLVFDTEADWILPLQSAKDKGAMIREIATVEAGGGGTELLSALEEAYRILKGDDSMLKHIIVLSDGEAPEKSFKELLEKVDQDKITVSTIAITSQAGQDLLNKIAQWGSGRYYFTDDLYALPRILTSETQLAANPGIIEESFRPLVDRKFHEILKGVDWNQAPNLHGYVATTLKALAEPLLVSPRDDPVLAVWQSGLGRTAAFTSDVKGRWGQDWLAWNEFNKFFGQLVRWTLRSRPSDIVSHLHFDDHQGMLSVNVTDENGRYINFLEGQADVVFPDKSRMTVPFGQYAPGHYSATFPIGKEGVYLAEISLKSSDKRTFGSAVSVGSIPEAIEYRQLALNTPMLLRVAEISGGRMLSTPGDVFQIEGVGTRRLELWPWLVVAALLAIIGDLALRWIKDHQPQKHIVTS